MERNINLTKLILLVVSLLWGAYMVANPISADQAKKNAAKFLYSDKRMASKTSRELSLAFTLQRPHQTTGKMTPMLYAYNINGDGGFVIVSGDDITRPVLGYSSQGGINVESMPDNMRMWLDRYANQIVWAQANGSHLAHVVTASGRKDVPYMVKTTWDQDDPYWNQCKFKNTYCYTGAVATAMAQIMYFWGVTGRNGEIFQHGCNALPQYTTDTKKYTVGALATVASFDWGNMTAGKPSTTVAKTAVAQLMRYCGQSVKTDYTDEGSVANSQDIPTAFIDNFGYSNTARIVYHENMTAEEWDELLYAEMAAGRPICLGGADETVGISHEFVCDGYQASTGMYHINWGWSGYYDNYFALDALEPGDMGSYNDGCDAIIGIEPPTGSVGPGGEDDPTTTLIDGIYYIIYFNDNTAEVTSHPNKYTGDISIPSTITYNGNSYSVTSIEGAAFSDCTGLTSITIGDNVTSIGNGAFYNCSSLITITIPNSVTSIGDEAFASCASLTSVYVNNPTPISIDSSTFPYRFNETLYVPIGSKEAYVSATYWRDFKEIIEQYQTTDIDNLSNAIYIPLSTANQGDKATLSVRMKNTTITVRGYQFDLYLPEGISFAKDEEGYYQVALSTSRTTERKMNYFDSSLQNDGALRVLCSSTNGATFDDTDGEVCSIVVEVDKTAPMREHLLQIKNAVVTNPEAIRFPLEDTVSILVVSETQKNKGDINEDGTIDISDVLMLVDMILGKEIVTPQNFLRGDMNDDGSIDISDVLIVVDIILGKAINL